MLEIKYPTYAEKLLEGDSFEDGLQYEKCRDKGGDLRCVHRAHEAAEFLPVWLCGASDDATHRGRGMLDPGCVQ